MRYTCEVLLMPAPVCSKPASMVVEPEKVLAPIKNNRLLVLFPLYSTFPDPLITFEKDRSIPGSKRIIALEACKTTFAVVLMDAVVDVPLPI